MKTRTGLKGKPVVMHRRLAGAIAVALVPPLVAACGIWPAPTPSPLPAEGTVLRAALDAMEGHTFACASSGPHVWSCETSGGPDTMVDGPDPVRYLLTITGDVTDSTIVKAVAVADQSASPEPSTDSVTGFAVDTVTLLAPESVREALKPWMLDHVEHRGRAVFEGASVAVSVTPHVTTIEILSP